MRVPVGKPVRRYMHTHTRFDSYKPSKLDLEGFLEHRHSGGKGALEIIFRESGTGRTRVFQLNYAAAKRLNDNYRLIDYLFP